MPFPLGQARRGRKGTPPPSLTYLPVVPTAHLIGKAFAAAEARRRGAGGREVALLIFGREDCSQEGGEQDSAAK